MIGKDGQDADAPARRAAARQAHLDGAAVLKSDGRLVTGGALLDDEQKMIGSMLLLDVESEEEARRLMEDDAYSRQGVWQELTVWPFRRAL